MAEPGSKAMAILRTRVNRIIEARNSTIKKTAAQCGLTREGLSRILNGRMDCSVVNAEKIANGLGMTIAELFTPDEESDKKSA